ncbi:hypothetical protein KIPB_015085 [Kipferlia bialata]|uniref:Uncharacterized protein n=1 Tax=Kipferlia bialata TaxID=797122 RepID=A0A9K3DAP3_9EUKA|nr:hypothetical protein KIPB_015085 [Kipferlia bialata]|eukprot:g15085.t1
MAPPVRHHLTPEKRETISRHLKRVAESMGEGANRCQSSLVVRLMDERGPNTSQYSLYDVLEVAGINKSSYYTMRKKMANQV